MKVKVINEFNLPEERFEYHKVHHADTYYTALDQLDSELRNQLKYCDENRGVVLFGRPCKEMFDVMESIRGFIRESVDLDIEY